MASKLLNKIALITGTTSGIGKACALALAHQGVSIIATGRRKLELETLADEIRKLKVRCHTIELDVRDYESIKKHLHDLPPEWQQIDILINNAGLALGLDKLDKGDIDDWNTMIDTNIKGLLYMTKLVLPGMIARNQGHIVNMGSVAGHETYSGGVVYCGTKFAVTAITEGIKKDLLGTAIRATLISPGLVRTEFSEVRFKGDTKKSDAVYQGVTPLSADDIAESILFCLTRPPHMNISEMLILATDQASATQVHRHL